MYFSEINNTWLMMALHNTLSIHSLVSKFCTHSSHDKGLYLIEPIKYKWWNYETYEPFNEWLSFLITILTSKSHNTYVRIGWENLLCPLLEKGVVLSKFSHWGILFLILLLPNSAKKKKRKIAHKSVIW
jgi:hypothetical protein